MEELRKIVMDIKVQDCRGTQNPIRCVLGTPKNYGDDEEDEEVEIEKMIMSYHFTEQQAEEWMKKFDYKYENMEIYVKSRYDNIGYSRMIKAMFDAVGEEIPDHYSI